jgi:hypothetical protein
MPERAKLVDGRLIFRLWISLMTRLVDKATVGDQRRPASRRRAPQIAGGLGLRPQKVAQRRCQAAEIIGARKFACGPARVAQFLPRGGFWRAFWRPKKRPVSLANVSGFSRGQLKRRS